MENLVIVVGDAHVTHLRVHLETDSTAVTRSPLLSPSYSSLIMYTYIHIQPSLPPLPRPPPSSHKLDYTCICITSTAAGTPPHPFAYIHLHLPISLRPLTSPSPPLPPTSSNVSPCTRGCRAEKQEFKNLMTLFAFSPVLLRVLRASSSCMTTQGTTNMGRPTSLMA